MEELTQSLLSITNQEFLWSVAMLTYFTCFGIVPNSNDLLMVAGAIVAKAKLIPLMSYLGTVVLAWVGGEMSLYLIGLYGGRKILAWDMFRKRVPMDWWTRIERMINLKPHLLLFMMRFNPVLRPLIHLGLGALGMKPRTFLSFHPLLLTTYICSVSTAFYLLGPWLQRWLGEYKIVLIVSFLIVWGGGIVLLGRYYYKKLMRESAA
jgi:membrane protein DedA with SNARE-associated domain